MDKTKIKYMDTKNLLLKDTTTVFMLPFSFDYDYFEHLKNSSIWEIATLRIDKNAFFPHIYKFMVENLTKKEKLNDNNCIIFSLKESWNNISEENKSIAKLFGKYDFEINIVENEKKYSDTFRFKILNEKSKLSSPKLILYPSANVGLLMISIELTGEKNKLNNLINLNYILHKITSNTPALKIILPQNSHEERIKERLKIYKSIAKYNALEYKKSNNDEPYSFYFYSIFRFLLFNFDKNEYDIEQFNNTRFHLFTYLQIDSSQHFEDCKQFDLNDLTKNFIRLVRCQNENYKVLSNYLDNNQIYLQTFENICFGASVEGACMMVDSQGTDSEFIKEFKNVALLARYLWIYLLVFFQRLSLIELNNKLMNINIDSVSKSNYRLGNIVTKLWFLKINSFFTEISDHTQHNEFYNFCSEKFLLKKHLDEINDKIRGVDILLSEKIEIQKNEIEQQKKKIEEQKNDLDAAIDSAQLIQKAIMPDIKDEILFSHFLLFMPKDKVSGDFYWTAKKDNKSVVIVADCTGHGVPGAFLSMLGISILNEIVVKQPILSASNILEKLGSNLEMLRQQVGVMCSYGMASSVCIIDYNKNEIEFAGTENSLYIVRKGILTEFKVNKISIGNESQKETQKQIENHIIKLEKKDMVYMFSDGYKSQLFHLDNRTKFQSTQLKKLLTEIALLPTNRQRIILKEKLKNWKGHLPQTDDITILGIKIL